MAIFEYKAISKEGKPSNGTIEAEDKPKASEKLISQGYKPLVVRAVKTGFDPNNIKIPGFTEKVKTKDLVIFTRQLSTMINAGVALVRALNTLTQQTDNDYFKGILEQVAHDIEGGTAFADALEKHPKAFSPIYINMVRAGEAGGILDDILKKLAVQQEKDATIRKKFKSAMTYPTVLMVIMVIAFFGMTLFVIPGIGKIVTDLAGEDTQLPIYTRIMLSMSDFMKVYWYIVVGGMIGGAYSFKRWHATEKGRYKFDIFMLKVPVLKTVIAKIAIARFARIFASLMSAGVAVIDSIEITAQAIGNTVIEKELMDASKEVANGKPLSEPLSQSEYFPPIVAQMLAIGEETGESDIILVKVADFYEEEVDTVVDSLSSIIEPLMIVLLGGMVGLIAASVMGPISELSKNIGSILFFL